MARGLMWLLVWALGTVVVACDDQTDEGTASPRPGDSPPAASGAPPAPPSLDLALALSLAQFEDVTNEEGKTVPRPGAARVEFLVREEGNWTMRAAEDSESNVFHKVMLYDPPGGEQRLLSIAGSVASVKLWNRGGSGLSATTLWRKNFGGKFSRMRDVEVADLFGDGRLSMAVATHDQGVVAILRPDGSGGFGVDEIDHEKDTFVHEIEIGDVNGDGIPEVYATPSEPNRLDGSIQSGHVVRYVPALGEGRKIVADLGDRHAKEILVADVDGDGRDELYVAVEGHMAKDTGVLIHGVEVRRYDADTAADAGRVIAQIPDRLCRFLTAGDVDGDSKQELVAAGFRSGLWLLRPGDDPMQPWSVESIDRDSGGFEHATILTDLDGDGVDELYVASDKHKQVRRYVWDGERLAREVIYRRPDDRSIFTWNLMPVPVELVP